MQDLGSLIVEGKYLLKSQKYRRAEEIFNEVLKTKKDLADVWNCMGLISHQEGRFGEAVKHFNKALKINPRYTEAMLNLSILYNDLGENNEAKKLVKKSRKEANSKKTAMDPFIRSKLANKHAEVADWYQGVGAYKEAIEEYKKALDLEPNYADIRTKMGVSMREMGKKADALKEFRKAIKAPRKIVDAYVQLGVTYYSMGKKPEAKRSWKQGLTKFPGNKTIKMYLKFADKK